MDGESKPLLSAKATLSCIPCKVEFETQSQLEAHVFSGQHRDTMATSPEFCTLCNVLVGAGPSNWETHCQGRKHSHLLDGQIFPGSSGDVENVWAIDSPPRVPVGLPPDPTQISPNISTKPKLATPKKEPEVKKKHESLQEDEYETNCPTCGLDYDTRITELHVNGKHHRKSLEARKREENIAQMINRVRVGEESGISFGRFSSVAAESGRLHCVLLPIKCGSRNVALTSITSAAKFGAGFYVDVDQIPLALELKMGATLMLPVVCRPCQRVGFLKDELFLRFEFLEGECSFQIKRAVCAEVTGLRYTREVPKLHLLEPLPYDTRVDYRAQMGSNFGKDSKSGSQPIAEIVSAIVAKGPHIDEIRQLMPADLNPKTYEAYWNVLLSLEESQMRADVESFDLIGVPLNLTSDCPRKVHGPRCLCDPLRLHVPALNERNPTQRIGDRIHLRRQAAQNIWYEVKISGFSSNNWIELDLPGDFNYLEGDLCDVRFTVNSTPFVRMRHALQAEAAERLVFPNYDHAASIERLTLADVLAVWPYDSRIENNPQQIEAVADIIRRPPGSLPFLVYGGPGTGKTVTVIESIRQVVTANPDARVLVCTPSNASADIIAERLFDTNRRIVLRLNSPTRDPKEARHLTEVSWFGTDLRYEVPPFTGLDAHNIIVSTCVSAALISHVVSSEYFSHIFIDEAGQATEPEVMIPLRLFAGPFTNVVLAGDPHQLGPSVRSSIARALGLGRSYFQRLLESPVYDPSVWSGINMIKLTKNFRSHESILRFPNTAFYEGELEIRGPPTRINNLIDTPLLPTPGIPILFHASCTHNIQDANRMSWYNFGEVNIINTYIKKLLSDTRRPLKPTDIGVISPFHPQVEKLKNLIHASYPSVTIGTVESFQGQERQVIIVSTVRSGDEEDVSNDLRYNLGLLNNPRRLNVAVNRAQALLIIAGDPFILGQDPLWRQLLNYIYKRGGWRGVEPDWDPREGFDMSARRSATQSTGAFTYSLIPSVKEDNMSDAETVTTFGKMDDWILAGPDSVSEDSEDYDDLRMEDLGHWKDWN